MNNQAGSGFGLALQRSADGFEAFAHTAQSVAFGGINAAAVVGDFQPTEIVVPLQTNAALSRLRMAHNVGHRLAQRQRQHGFLRRG